MVHTGLSWNVFQSKLTAEAEFPDCRAPRLHSRRSLRATSPAPERPTVLVTNTSFTTSRPASPLPTSRSQPPSPVLSPRCLSPLNSRNTVSFTWMPPSPGMASPGFLAQTMRFDSAGEISPRFRSKPPQVITGTTRSASPRVHRKTLPAEYFSSAPVTRRSISPFVERLPRMGSGRSPSPSRFDRRSSFKAASVSCAPGHAEAFDRRLPSKAASISCAPGNAEAFDRRSSSKAASVCCAPVHVEGRSTSPTPFDRRSSLKAASVSCAPGNLDRRSMSPTPFDRRSSMKAASVCCAPGHVESRSRSPTPFERRSSLKPASVSCSPRHADGTRSSSPTPFDRRSSFKAATVSCMPGPPGKRAHKFAWTPPAPADSQQKQQSPRRNWNGVPVISTSSIASPPAPAPVASFKFATPASGGSSSTATPSQTSPRLSAQSSNPASRITSPRVGSSLASSASEEALPENSQEANGVVPVPEPHIFASRIVDRIMGMGIVKAQPGTTMKRLVDAETGEKETVVIDENGRKTSFSQDTVSSVMTGAFKAARVLPPKLARASIKKCAVTRDENGRIKAIGDESIDDFFDETVMRRWMGSLRKCNLKGFDQELRFRLSDIWTEYAKVKEEHEDYLENADYIFFGLSKDATLKDLEKAFRKLARRMHPDKNGGSEEAKARFQELTERYEKLKRKMMRKQGWNPDDDKQKELLDEGQEYREDEDSDSDDSKSEDGTPETKTEEKKKEEDLDRDAMEKKIWELVDTAKLMQRQMRNWREQIKRAAFGC